MQRPRCNYIIQESHVYITFHWLNTQLTYLDLTTNHMKETSKIILRWIAVPFVATLGYLAAYYLIWFICVISGIGHNIYTGGFSLTKTWGFNWNDIIYTISLFLRDTIGGYAFVLAGTYTAPFGNKIVSTVLATFAVCFCILNIVLVSIGFSENSFMFWLSMIATIIGAIGGCIKIHQND